MLEVHDLRVYHECSCRIIIQLKLALALLPSILIFKNIYFARGVNSSFPIFSIFRERTCLTFRSLASFPYNVFITTQHICPSKSHFLFYSWGSATWSFSDCRHTFPMAFSPLTPPTHPAPIVYHLFSPAANCCQMFTYP